MKKTIDDKLVGEVFEVNDKTEIVSIQYGPFEIAEVSMKLVPDAKVGDYYTVKKYLDNDEEKIEIGKKVNPTYKK